MYSVWGAACAQVRRSALMRVAGCDKIDMRDRAIFVCVWLRA